MNFIRHSREQGDRDNNLLSGLSWMLSVLRIERLPLHDDSTHLTHFPFPGEAHVSGEGNFRPFTRLKPNGILEGRVERSKRSTDSSTSSRHSRDLWMPDRLCRACHECELPFNMLRRRHHCRFCGQVFCHACASTFVDGKSLLQRGFVRTCNVCYIQITNQPSQRQNESSTSLTLLQAHPQVERKAANVDQASVPTGLLWREADGLSSEALHASRTRDPHGLACFRVAMKSAFRPYEVEEVPMVIQNALQNSCRLLHLKDTRGLECADAHGFRGRTTFCFNGIASHAEGPNADVTRASMELPEELRFLATKTDELEVKLRHRLGGNERAAPAIPIVPETVLTTFADGIFALKRSLCVRGSSTLSSLVLSLLQIHLASDCSSLELWCRTIVDLVVAASGKFNPSPAGKAPDIRPFVKLKTIPGGKVHESSCIDGLVFRKNILNKNMARTRKTPRIMLISSSVGFHRTCARLTSFETLREQEQRFTHIIVEKIKLLGPDLLLVGGDVSRQAQDYLNYLNVTVIQHVKNSLLDRVANITGACILCSADQVNRFSQPGPTSLGICQHFHSVSCTVVHSPRIAAESDHKINSQARSMYDVPLTPEYRTNAFVYLIGCHEQLGCTIVLRGEGRRVLKKIKRIARFALVVAFHIRREATFLATCRACRPCVGAQKFNSCASSSMRADLSTGMLARFSRQEALTHLTLKHQSFLVTRVWMNHRLQCIPAELMVVTYYTGEDVSLRRFLQNPCVDLDLRLPFNERSHASDIKQLLYHSCGCLTVAVRHNEDLPSVSDTDLSQNLEAPLPFRKSVLTWAYCRVCKCVVTPMAPVAEEVLNMSFGKFLEAAFYNRSCVCCASICRHRVQQNHILHFGYENVTIRVEYSRVRAYRILVRQRMQFERTLYIQKVLQQYDHASKVIKIYTQLLLAKVKQLETLLNITAFGNTCTKISWLLLHADPTTRLKHRLARLSANVKGYCSWFHAKLLKWKLDFASPEATSPTCTIRQFMQRNHRELHVHAARWNAEVSEIGRMATELQGKLNRIQGDLYPAHEDLNSVSQESRHMAHGVADSIASFSGCHGEKAEKNPVEVPCSAASFPSAVLRSRTYAESLGVIHVLPPTDQLVDRQASDTRICDPDDSLKFGQNSQYTKASLQSVACVSSEVLAHTVASVTNSIHDDSSNRLSCKIPESGTTGRSNSRGSELASILPDNTDPSLDNRGRREHGSAQQGRRTNKLTSALARFIGKESPGKLPWSMHLKDLETYLLTVHADDSGALLAIFEELPTCIISYSLRTTEYKKALQRYISEQHFPHDLNNNSYFHSSIANFGGDYDSTSYRASILSTSHADATQGWSSKVPPMLLDRDAALLGLVTEDAKASGSHKCERGEITLESMPRCSAWSETRTQECRRTVIRPRSADNKQAHGRKGEQEQKSCSVVCESLEQRLLSHLKTHVKHRFTDVDEQGNVVSKCVCQAYWAVQFAAVRQAYLGIGEKAEADYLRSLSLARRWNAQGGKSGATFLKTLDNRFVIKQITRTELLMFLEYAPAYFEYLSKALFHELSTLLVRVFGVYQIGSHNKVSGRRTMEHVVVMENLFHNYSVTRAFDLKGSARSRYARASTQVKNSVVPSSVSILERRLGLTGISYFADMERPVLLDDNFMEYTKGRPMPLQDRSKIYFNRAVLNDTLFLSLINVVDYSILVGVNEDGYEVVAGIIDYMRQYDIIKKMERMGKSVGMIAGQAEPTVIQPHNYRERFRLAMERYFMMIPDKWTPVRLRKCGCEDVAQLFKQRA